MLAAAEAGPLDEFQRARAALIRGQIAFALSHGSEAPQLLLESARQFEPLDPGLAREVYLETLFATVYAGHLAYGGGVREVAAAARAGPPPKPVRALDLLLAGLALTIIEDYSVGAPTLARATRAFCTMTVSAEDVLKWAWHSCCGAAMLWDYRSWDFLSARWVNVAREVGALTVLPIALTGPGTRACGRRLATAIGGRSRQRA